MGHLRVRDPEGGSNQSGLRGQNARLVLSYIRLHGAMASAEIARRSGLSAQTVSNIVRSLEADGLLIRGDTVKGRVGKPSVPMELNPQGAFGLGLSIGRRSLELMLVNFKGMPIDTEVISYPYPTRDAVFEFVEEKTAAILGRAGVARERVAGLGIARPNRIWEWGEFIKAPEGAMQDWKTVKLKEELSARTGLRTVLENDATAACVAEHLLGRGHDLSDFFYIFLGTFVGGGLVLGGNVISGRTLNAAALGPLPVPDGRGGAVQLLDVASLHVLERRLDDAGFQGDAMRAEDVSWDEFEPLLTKWIKATSHHLAVATAAITSVAEVEAILLDGAFPVEVRARITQSIRQAFSELDITGIQKIAIDEAQVGRRARSIGAALLPIHESFFSV